MSANDPKRTSDLADQITEPVTASAASEHRTNVVKCPRNALGAPIALGSEYEAGVAAVV
jgi:hypothetical protein